MISRRDLIFGTLFMLPGKAAAHSWYTGKSNPVTGGGCCGVYDCFSVDASEIVPENDGYRWLKAPNPDTGWISQAEVLLSEDNGWHVCWRAGRLYCLFAPFNT